MMLIGVITIAVAIARLVLILCYDRKLTNSATAIDLLTEIEAVVAGCVACLPAMRALFRRKRNELVKAENKI